MGPFPCSAIALLVLVIPQVENIPQKMNVKNLLLWTKFNRLVAK